MSKREDNALFQDMKGAIDRIILYTSKIEYEDFVQDNKTQDAVMKNIEILGEASKLLSDEIKDRYPEIPWREIAGTRDKIDS